jgi:hypothetical protein
MGQSNVHGSLQRIDTGFAHDTIDFCHLRVWALSIFSGVRLFLLYVVADKP